MILVDANVLLYAYVPGAAFHDRARTWIEDVFTRGEPVGLAWATILAFLRISTAPRIFENPLTTDEATAVVSSWLVQPSVTVLDPGERHWAILNTLLVKTQSRGALVSDAHLAALAIEHGAALCTSDRGFVRFPGLRVVNPLEHEPGL